MTDVFFFSLSGIEAYAPSDVSRIFRTLKQSTGFVKDRNYLEWGVLRRVDYANHDKTTSNLLAVFPLPHGNARLGVQPSRYYSHHGGGLDGSPLHRCGRDRTLAVYAEPPGDDPGTTRLALGRTVSCLACVGDFRLI